MNKGLPILGLFLLLAGNALAAPRETLRLHDGRSIENVNHITFDGNVFNVHGQDAVPRDQVSTVEFALDAPAGAETGEVDAAGELSDLARQCLPRGVELAKQSPGVGGVVLVDDGEFVYHANGTSGYRYHFAGLVLKEEMTQWAELAVGFSEGRSRARILYGRAVGQDGSERVLTPDMVKVSSPSEEMVFFNPNRKLLSAVIPGVEVGSIVEYAYEYDYYNPEDPRLFSPGYYFQGEEPVVFSRVRVELPDHVPFHYFTRNFPEGVSGEPLKETNGNTVSYTWLIENMPSVTPEPLMPPIHDVVPMMEASIFKDWADVFDLLAQLQKARMTLTPEIEAAVAEIIQGAESVDEKIARIYHWVQENTRYISIKGSLGAGFSGHTAYETFTNRYGDCTDKAVLLGTMLRAVGVDSYPVIVQTNDAGTAVTEIPNLSGNHCINEVCLPDRSFYLDSTAQTYRYPYFREDDHGIYAINAIRGTVSRTPVPAPENNRRISHLDVKLTADGHGEVRTSNAYNGSIEAGVRAFWKQTREDNRKLMMAEYVNSISPGAELLDFTLSDLNDLAVPLTMDIDYALRGLGIRAKALLYLKLPTLEREFPEAALDQRRYPIEYRSTEERILEIDVELPSRFRAQWLPPALDIVNPNVEYHGRYEEHEGRIEFRGEFRRLVRTVPVADYPAYRDALRAIAAFTQKEIFLTDED